MSSFKKELIQRIISGLIYASLFLFSAKSNNLFFLQILLTFFFIISCFEFYNITKLSRSILLKFFFPFLYLLAPILAIYFIKIEFGSPYLIFLIIIVWINDISAFLVGKSIGKIKISNISPNKTMEGLIGSFLVCILTTPYLIENLHLKLDINDFLLAILISISSNMGDLLESFIKRQFNKKDSGQIIIGHGGLLDRIDSLLLSAPLFYIILKINSN